MPRRTRWAGKLPLALGFLALAGACTSPADRRDSTVPGRCELSSPGIVPQKTDILFVIDNSNSMREEQEGIARELPAFITELVRGGGVTQDFQVGVITTTVYLNAVIPPGGQTYSEFPDQSGTLREVPPPPADGGTAPGGERILHGDDPQLAEKFARLVQQGVTGSGQETPFEAVRLAVTEPRVSDTNKGFLRDDARLLVVVVSDEDDCSETHRPPKVSIGVSTNIDYCTSQSSNLTTVEEYFNTFTHLTDGTGARRPVLWATIGPVGRTDKTAQVILDNTQIRNVDCPTSNGPGYRHHRMAELFDNSLANLDSICNTSYRQSLVNIAAIANTNPTIEVMNVPDPALIKVEITRGDGHVDACTVAAGDISYEPATPTHTARIHFEASCPRRADDQAVEVKLLCAG